MLFGTGPPSHSQSLIQQNEDPVILPYWKWILIFKLLSLYCLIAPILILALYLSGNLKISNYQFNSPSFFVPFDKFGMFFETHTWTGPFLEETLYRGPIWIWAVVGGSLLKKKWPKLNFVLTFLIILIPTFLWMETHSTLSWAVFCAGLGWGWLVYKTKSLWPAIVSHSFANILIYFSIKFVGLFIKI